MIRGRDDKAFAVEMAATASTFGSELSEGKIDTYWEALKDLPIEVVCAGLREARRSLRFFPKPVEIRELAVGADEDRAAIVWAHAMKLARRASVGQRVDLGDAAAHTAIEMLGGWRRVWVLGRPDVPEIEVENVKREFVRFYHLALRRPDLTDSTPKVLVDQEERRRGLVFGPILRAKTPSALPATTAALPPAPNAEADDS